MERLTCADKPMLKPWVHSTEAIKRLYDYEASGLEPEEIEQAMSDCAEMAVRNQFAIKDLNELGGIDHLRELVHAEKEGRLVVLPCKVGDTIYLSHWWDHTNSVAQLTPISRKIQYFSLQKTGMYAHVLEGSMHVECFGEYAFLTREEAEAALKAQKGEKL